MRLQSILCLVGFVALSTTAAHAGAPNIQAQRNCQQGDLYLAPTSAAQYTQCIWKQNDSSAMSVTLHLAKKVDFVIGHCLFEPAAADSLDKISAIETSKSGLENGSQRPWPINFSYQIIDGNQIKFIARNFNSFLDDSLDYPSHMNILFELNNKRFNDGDQIQCEFLSL